MIHKNSALIKECSDKTEKNIQSSYNSNSVCWTKQSYLLAKTTPVSHDVKLKSNWQVIATLSPECVDK